MDMQSNQSALVLSPSRVPLTRPPSSTQNIESIIEDKQYYNRLTITGTSSGDTFYYRVSAGGGSGYVKAEVLKASWAGWLLLIGYEWPSIIALSGWLKGGKGPDPLRATLRIVAEYPYTRGFNMESAYTIVGGDCEIKNIPRSVLEGSWVGRTLLVEWDNSGWAAYVNYLCHSFLTCG
ncbi:MAG: hypothetical protein M1840_003241 [Geoglossum simile]|nr:MAG: hypothetical protein M1840_003241 [Geoglossum simile]